MNPLNQGVKNGQTSSCFQQFIQPLAHTVSRLNNKWVTATLKQKVRHFSSSYSLPTFELAAFKPLLTSHWTSLIWKLTSILKAFTKKLILHLCTSSMTAGNILVAQGVNHAPKMSPSQHHHSVITGKEQHNWLSSRHRLQMKVFDDLKIHLHERHF